MSRAVRSASAVSPVSTSEHVDLTLTGMTCAACASRIENKLNRLDGVGASVNYATEKASVVFDPTVVSTGDLRTAVEAIGYGADLLVAGFPDIDDDRDERRRRSLLRRLIVAAGLGGPVLMMSMVPAVQFRNWQWVAFVLATPVATWAAAPFHRAALKNARHGEATMDTLVSVGVLAAYGWSVYALFFTEAGDAGMTMPMSLFPSRTDAHHLYFEVASTTVALILVGRYFEARANGAPAARCAPYYGSARRRQRSFFRPGNRSSVRSTNYVSAIDSRCCPGRGSRPMVSSRRARPRSMHRSSRERACRSMSPKEAS